MAEQELESQVFQTPDQWEGGGLLYRLKTLEDGGISLYSVPSFSQWILAGDGIKNPVCLVVDECGQVYFIDKEIKREAKKEQEYYQIYRYDPEIERLEPIPCAGSSEVKHSMFKNPMKIVVDRFTLWVFDAGNRDTGARITAFSRENYQIKYVLEDFKAPVDISLGNRAVFMFSTKKSKLLKSAGMTFTATFAAIKSSMEKLPVNSV